MNGPNGDRQELAGMLYIDGSSYGFLGPQGGGKNHSTGVLFGVDNSGGDLPNMPVTLSSVVSRLIVTFVLILA